MNFAKSKQLKLKVKHYLGKACAIFLFVFLL